MWMRGGTFRGGCVLAADLPGAAADRDAVLPGAMGSPYHGQIDGMGAPRP